MLLIYKLLTSISAPLLALLLWHRVGKGKEDAKRLLERKGIASIPRPKGQLIWIHAASVGEAQSALILIEKINHDGLNIFFLVTSGTKTSAELMAKRLPKNAIHQYYPLDHPKWVKKFLTHWQPDLALWMESELWPNMLLSVKQKKIPAILVNARLSLKSYNRWNFFKSSIKKLLLAFDLILAQTVLDTERFKKLGARKVITTDNLKHSAAPLPYKEHDLENLVKAIENRPTWLYASTHDGEESLACRIHSDLKEKHPNILTIIVPRHPERREDIQKQCQIMGENTVLRGENKNLPDSQTDIYIADTLGELGLFYRLCEITVIGRSFSHDGGGGHNPIEAAQLNCAILTGPNIQYQLELFDEMIAQNAVLKVQSEEELLKFLEQLLSNSELKEKYIKASDNYAQSKGHIIENVMSQIKPYLSLKEKEVI